MESSLTIIFCHSLLEHDSGMLPPFLEDQLLWRRIRGARHSSMLSTTCTRSCTLLILVHTALEMIVVYFIGWERAKERMSTRIRTRLMLLLFMLAKWATLLTMKGMSSLRLMAGMQRLMQGHSFQNLDRLWCSTDPRSLDMMRSDDTYCIDALDTCYSLWCNMSLYKIPTIVDLRTVSLRLTAYSLRCDRVRND